MALANTLDLPTSSEERQENAAVPGIAASVAAIAASVQRLQPLLQKAQRLRSQRQPLVAVQEGEGGLGGGGELQC